MHVRLTIGKIKLIKVLFLSSIMVSCAENNDNSAKIGDQIPEIDGEWWIVASNPDLGALTNDQQQPVDFGIWQASDGSWQLWSCIRKTKESGHTRLFHGWEGKTLDERNWQPKGIMMRADSTLGEDPGGLQAPYVLKHQDRHYMFYGDWNRICLAESVDGKIFNRTLRNGSPSLFGDPGETNTRDPMIIQHDGLWYCYYTAHPNNDGAIYLRTSKDFYSWSSSEIVCYGGSPGKGKLWLAECPHVIKLSEKDFYLFRTYSYGNYQNGELISPPKTKVYRSTDPSNFGIDSDDCLITELPVAAPEIIHHEGNWYIAALRNDLQGIRIARLKWNGAD
jgi:hypothetical protein